MPSVDEDERRTALHDLRLASVMGEHEHRHVERGVVAPPAVCPRIVLPGAFTAAEHLSAHHDGAGGVDPFFDDFGVGILLTAFEAVALAPARGRNGPLVQEVAARSQRLLEVRVRPGGEPIQ